VLFLFKGGVVGVYDKELIKLEAKKEL